jgi:UDP-N-acetyl-D-glucosamine/UDP-N-acetyl-D-galactosamine dehydrogenase
VVDLVRELESFGAKVEVHDPLVGAERLRGMGLAPAGVAPLSDLVASHQAVVLAVPHAGYRPAIMAALPSAATLGCRLVVDVKGVLPGETASFVRLWRL